MNSVARFDERALGWSGMAAVITAGACIANAFAYALLAANPLIQSDIWRYLDGFLGTYIERGFSLSVLFARADMNDANMPLHKLVLFLHTSLFDMDFLCEAAIAMLCCVVCVLSLVRLAANRGIGNWRNREYWLLAGLCLVLLSLNSTQIYSWPRATMWYVPILVSFVYFRIMKEARVVQVVALTFFLGVLLLEFALPVVAAVLGALWASRLATPRRLGAIAIAAATGLLAAAMFYWSFEWSIGGVDVAMSKPRSFAAFADAGVWQMLVLPLADSMVHESNVHALFGRFLPLASVLPWLLLVAHAWFWWRVFMRRKDINPDSSAATYAAVAVMLFFYGLLVGIMVQRVPEFGFKYLHQPRYVLFYQLNLAALLVLAYRETAGVSWTWRSRAGIAMAIALSCALQLRLSELAWAHLQYASRYYEQAALDMGRVAQAPTTDIECVPVVTVCKFPEKRRERIMRMLASHRLNLFSPAFQARHRLYPDGRSPLALAADPAVP
jgi:hypothetical protein